MGDAGVVKPSCFRTLHNKYTCSTRNQLSILKSVSGKGLTRSSATARHSICFATRSHAAFQHPGVLHTRADLDRVKQMVQQRVEPWNSGFEKLKDHRQSQAAWCVRGPFEKVTRGPRENLHNAELADDDGSTVTLEPGPREGVLLNPGKGWSAGGSPQRHPKEVLDLLGMGVMRLDWAGVEPQEGQFNWDALDRFLDSWGRLGKVEIPR